MTAVSGKVGYLVVGSHPGMTKVQAAIVRNVKLLNLRGLGQLITGVPSRDISDPEISEFSRGYGKNSVALANPEQADELLASLGGGALE